MKKVKKLPLFLALVLVSTLFLSSIPALAGESPHSGKSLVEARQALEQQLVGMPGFVGIAHSEEEGEIVVFLEDEQAKGIVSNRCEGYPVRREVTGRLEALSTQVAETMVISQANQVGLSRTGIVRPLIGGISVSAYVAGEPWAGTLGMVTYDNKILSNAHVIALGPDNNFLPAGTPVIQPGSLDGGTPSNRVGELEGYTEIIFSTDDNPVPNYADAATATIDPGVEGLSGWQFGGGSDYQVSGTTTVTPGDTVRKSGRTTDVTESEVRLTNASVWVGYGDQKAYFVDQITVYQPFSQEGDSGSAVDKDGDFVGLLFAGGDTICAVCKAEHIIDELGIAVEPTGPGQADITVSPPGFDVTLPSNTIQDYTLAVGNDGDATLAYSISDRQTIGGTGQGDNAEMFIRLARKVLETPVESTEVEPGDITPQVQGSWQNIMTESFEGSFPGMWDVFCEEGSIDAYWAKDSHNPYSGFYSAFCAGGGAAGVDPPSDYPNNMDAFMVCGPFSLADATSAELSFYWWYDTQVEHDSVVCLALVDEDNFVSASGSGITQGWESKSLDLGSLCGRPAVYVAFAFVSDAAGTDKGAFVDDVVLRKYVSGASNPPNVPYNPSPANHAADIPINADLSWTGGDPDAGDVVTYDVYLGTSASPPLVSNDQWVTTYDPGTMADGTKYYWKIVATDNHGASTTGPIWDFTTGGVVEDCPWLDENPKSGSLPAGGINSITVTINTVGPTVGCTYTAEIVIANNDPDENPKIVPVTLHVGPSGGNNPPNMPSNPSPANHAPGIPLNACLSWTGGDPDPGDTVTYDVYFGTNPSPQLVCSDKSEATCCPGPLAYDTKYYWYVVATDNHGESTTVPSPWDFTTSTGAADITVSPPSFDVWLPPDTSRDYTLTIGNNGGATLTYSISDKQPAGGVGVADREDVFSIKSASMALEVPLESKPVQPQNAGPAATGWQVIMTDGFEGTFPGVWELWVPSGATDAYWGKDSYRAHSGSYSAFCAKTGTAAVNPPADYPNDMYAWMIYGPFNLADATDAEVEFYFWLDSESDYDTLGLYASVDGLDFYGKGWSGDYGDWKGRSFDLTNVWSLGNLCGESQVWIAFIFESDESNTDKGAFIDDVVLRKRVGAANNPPNTPSAPSPANHASGVSIDADLSWSGGDPDAGDSVTYDVYFGTSSSPPLVSDDQPGTAYDPGTLTLNAEYYWKIIATDSHGATTAGPLWDFTTGSGLNNPPNAPSSPSPANHAIGVSVNANLSWAGGDPDAGDTVTYDVYFGTSTVPPLVSNNQPGTAYDLGTLNFNTRYYWKIVATDNQGASASGLLWDFTTTGAGGDCLWLDENPKSGSVPAGGSIDITVTINTAGLTVGSTYTAEIVITSNDPDENPKVVPVTLRVRERGPAVTWDLPWGLDADPAAVNIWIYPADTMAVTLADVDWSMPSGLLIWYYGGPVEGWCFYKKGWGTVNTLETLMPGKGYIAIAPTASVWEIPQG